MDTPSTPDTVPFAATCPGCGIPLADATQVMCTRCANR